MTRRAYLVVDAAVLLLALVSVALAHTDLHGFNAAAALAIAATKAALIAIFFMELKLAGPVPRVVAAASVFWLAILVVGTMDDVLTRAWLPIPGK